VGAGRHRGDAGVDRWPAALEAAAVPASLRDLDVASGQAADYDTWLTAVSA
jgi:hypothetical protein